MKKYFLTDLKNFLFKKIKLQGRRLPGFVLQALLFMFFLHAFTFTGYGQTTIWTDNDNPTVDEHFDSNIPADWVCSETPSYLNPKAICIWVGSVSTDWHNAKNWEQGTIPTSTTDVKILNVTNEPTISADAECRNIEIKDNSSLTISGSNTLSVYGDWKNDGTFTPGTGNVSFNGTDAQTITVGGTGAGKSFYNVIVDKLKKNAKLGSDIDINGSFTIINGTWDVTKNYAMNVAGNWNNNGTFNCGGGTVTFKGSDAQKISGTSSTTFNNLTINNSSLVTQGVTVATSSIVNKALTLTKGIVNTKPYDGASTLTLIKDASTDIGVGGTSPSYINGQLIKIVSKSKDFDTVYFPIGKVIPGSPPVSNYRPCELRVKHKNKDEAVYTCELVQASAQALDYELPKGIDHVSPTRYWIISRNQTTPYNLTNAKIKLYYYEGGDNGDGDGVTDIANLTIVKSTGDGGPWIDINGTATTNGTGTIGFSDVLSSFSMVTLGSKNGNNPLPISLLKFNAVCENHKVDINWSTATETNNDYFTIQRSVNASDWEFVKNIPGGGNSNSTLYYSATDNNPLNGTSYYRLKQTDYDGQSETFSPVSVICGEDQDMQSITYYPNPFTSEVMVNMRKITYDKAVLAIYDLLGKKVYEMMLSGKEPLNQEVKLDLHMLPAGVYSVIFKSNGYSSTSKIVKNY